MKSVNHCICLAFLCNLPHISSDYLAGITDLDFLFSLSPAAHMTELKKERKEKEYRAIFGAVRMGSCRQKTDIKQAR